ncbi:BRCT domain-containing protein [Zunongwangia pacifica]|uniref:BRCT domain-containing protein n=1 Tax=Zunongwangia pacifica TaxID=2911062 RepID=A0A9X2A2Z2_9FLAO|nr:BRCT domain-containing protein [Zunongwangia pacifica]MCL6219214.1 hypothetical protein [Zunongwangia pacifica]
MTLQIIITAYILVFLGIIYLTWNHFFNSTEDEDAVSEDTKTDIAIDTENVFEGKKVVFDGELDAFREKIIRKELTNRHAILEDKMAEDTKFLIIGKNPDWLVVEEAKDHGVTIVNEMDWQKTINPVKNEFSTETNLLREPSEMDSAEIV